jgi:DNA-binding NtrC family response regulator
MSSPLPKTKRKRRILVVDNEYDITFTLRKGLENCGMFEVDTFNDPQEALSSLTPDYYDFLLPHMSDYDLYEYKEDRQ